MTPDELVLGSRVAAAVPLAWGFTNRSWRVDLRDGRRVVLQRFADPAAGARRVARMRALASRFAAAGLPGVPEVLHEGPGTAVTSWVDGRVGSDLLEEGVPLGLAAAAADVVKRLRAVDVSDPGLDLELDTVWASSETLATVSTERIRRLSPLSPASERTLAAVINSLPDRFAGRTACFAHGDLNPSNVLVGKSAQIVALLDLEFARLAHPAFDASWWDWVIRFHYPAKWPAMREAFDAAAGDARDSASDVLALQQLRTLELAADATPDTRAMWLERLDATARWR